MSEKTCKDCMYCSIEGDNEAYCSGVPLNHPFDESYIVSLNKKACKYFLGGDKPTIFDQITASPEVLAERLVYCLNSSSLRVIDSAGRLLAYENEVWGSTVLPGSFWTEYNKAFDATVARLKEGTQ